MAAPTNTALTTGVSALIGQREDLSPKINRISPTTTPFYTWCAKGEATNDTNHEWQTQALRTPVDTNAAAEGDVWVPTPPQLTKRIGNACQIVREVASVSNTAQAVEKAGRSDELAYQALLKGFSARQDLEKSLLANKVAKRTDPRVMGGLPTYVSTATASVGATGTAPTGDGNTLVVEGTGRALTLDMFDGMIQTMYEAGGMPAYAMMNGTRKRAFDTLAANGNLATNFTTALKAQPTGGPGINRGSGITYSRTVSIYASAFGNIEIFLNQWMASSQIFIFDERSEFQPTVDVLPGRNWTKYAPQLNFDGVAQAIAWEGTLKVPAPSAVGAIFGLS